jgi:hypothetical protein
MPDALIVAPVDAPTTTSASMPPTGVSIVWRNASISVNATLAVVARSQSPATPLEMVRSVISDAMMSLIREPWKGR